MARPDTPLRKETDAALDADEVLGADGRTRELETRGVAERGDDGRGRDDRRWLADALGAVGRVGVRLLDEHGLDGWHVERGRDQVVGEARIRDQAVARLDLLHEREP